jgi:N-acetylglutamate synthase-like GNAT family acetyltransferase
VTVVVRLLADVPHLTDAVGDLGASWLAPGRDELPVTFVAVDATGTPLGAVTLDQGPRVVDLVVRADMRDRGIGRALLSRLERFAVGRDMPEIWVTAEARDVDFFERCGWRSTEQDGTRTVLRKVT